MEDQEAKNADLKSLLQQMCAEFRVFPGGKNPQHNNALRFNFEQLSQTIFSEVSSDELPTLLVRLLEYLPSFLRAHSSVHVFQLNNVCRSIPLTQLVVQTIINVLLPRVSTRQNNKPGSTTSCESITDHQPNQPTKKRARRQSKRSFSPAPLQMPLSHAEQFLRLALPLYFPIETKIWKSLAFVLHMKQNLNVFGPILTEAFRKGDASFSALAFFMHDPQFSRFMDDASVILQALYTGPLRATTVEALVAHRSKEFRQQCRDVLFQAEEATRDKKKYVALKPANVPCEIGTTAPWTFDKFSSNTRQLMRDMRGEAADPDTLIHTGWAVAAVKKFARKYYIEKVWKQENLNELIWTVLCQRPHLKTVVCNILSKEFQDHNAANRWRRFSGALEMRRDVQGLVTSFDPLQDTEEYLNFPIGVKSVEWLFKESHLVALWDLLNSYVQNGERVVVSLDAEWSAYVSHSRASILQLATKDQVFIVDLESKDLPEAALRTFFEKLFLTDEILKIGFQFHEDLQQLRAAVSKCPALFHPKNLICIGKLVTQIVKETLNRENGRDLLTETVPGLADILQKAADSASSETALDNTFETPAKMDADSSKSGAELEDEDDAVVVPMETDNDGNKRSRPSRTEHLVLSKGLSALCECILGRPLDKAEQCSVWDRRPLRPLQMRYAAMDAYCLLLIYEKCGELATMLEMDLREIEKRQDPIFVSLPLFSGDD